MKGHFSIEKLHEHLRGVFEDHPPPGHPWPTFEPDTTERYEIRLDDLAAPDPEGGLLTEDVRDVLQELPEDEASRAIWAEALATRDQAERRTPANIDLLDYPERWWREGPGPSSGPRAAGPPLGPPPPHDILAWYQPFHYHPEDWGIFLREDAIIAIARALVVGTRVALRGPPTDLHLSECLRAAGLILYEHEFFHHQVECFATRAEVHVRDRVYVTQFRGPHRLLEEALANARAYLAVRPKGGARLESTVAKVAQVYLDAVIPISPPGYRDAVLYLAPGLLRGGTRQLQEEICQATWGGQPERHQLWDVVPYAMAGFGRKSSRIYCVVKKSGARTYPVLFWSFSTKQIISICRALGLEIRPDKGKGSHLRVYKPDGTAVTTLPGGRHDLAKGTARSILRDLELSPQQATELLVS